MSYGKRYFVLDGYKHISKENKIIITQPFNQKSIRVTREQWISVIGSDLPKVRNDVGINDSEYQKLAQMSNAT